MHQSLLLARDIALELSLGDLNWLVFNFLNHGYFPHEDLICDLDKLGSAMHLADSRSIVKGALLANSFVLEALLLPLVRGA